jgi:hypothetical protein
MTRRPSRGCRWLPHQALSSARSEMFGGREGCLAMQKAAVLSSASNGVAAVSQERNVTSKPQAVCTNASEAATHAGLVRCQVCAACREPPFGYSRDERLSPPQPWTSPSTDEVQRPARQPMKMLPCWGHAVNKPWAVALTAALAPRCRHAATKPQA